MSDKVVYLPVDVLDEHPDNRAIYGDTDNKLSELVASVRICGVLDPLIVRLKEDGRYEVLSGHRRRRAAELAGFKEVPCIVREDGTDPALVLIEANRPAREPTLMQKARQIRRLKELWGTGRGRPKGEKGNNGSQKQGIMPELLGMDERYVRRLDKLNDLIPELQDCVDRGVFGVLLGERLAGLPPEVQRSLYEVLGDDIRSLGLEEVKRLKEESDRGYFVLEVMQRRIKELESELEERDRRSGDISDLERRISVLRSKKRELERDVLDRESAVRIVKERVEKSGAALCNLIEQIASPVAAAKPQVEALLEEPLNPATAANIMKWAQVLVEVGFIVQAAVDRAVGGPETEVSREQKVSG